MALMDNQHMSSASSSNSASNSSSSSSNKDEAKVIQSNGQLSITAEKLNDINKAAKETVQSLNNVFSAVSGSGNVARTFDDLTNGIQNASSALDALTRQTSNPDAALNNVASVQAQFDGLQSAYANINSKLSDLIKSTDTSAIDDVDKVIHNIEKMEQSTSDVSKALKRSLQKMAEYSGNTEEINSTLKTLENNFANVADEIKSRFNELIQKQVQDIVSGIQDTADASLVAISNGRGLQGSFNNSITRTGNNAAYAYQNAVVAQQMNNRQHFWNQSSANFNGIANTASEMGVMQTQYEDVSSRVRDSYTNAEHEDDPEKRKQLIKEANEQYHNLVSIQKAMNDKAKELGKQMHLVSPDDIKRLGQEGKDLQKQIKKILSETSANSGRLISIGAAFNVKDNEEVAKGFAKDKEELDKVNNSLDDINKKTGDLAKTIKNDLASSFNTLMAPFRTLGKFLPLLGAGGMFGLMNNITKPLQYYSEKHKDMYSSMGTDAYAGVDDLGASQANANARLMRGNSLYAMSGGMIDRRAINNSYNSAMREVGGAYGSTPSQGAAEMNELVNKTALMQNVWGIDQGTMNNAYQTFYKDMRMNASEAANAIARVAQTAQASGIPVGKYLNMISGLAHDFMKIGIDGDKAETVMSGLLGKGMRADVAQDIAGQSANAMGGFAQNYNMVGYAAAMQGMDPFHGLALAAYSHEANGEVRHGWAGDMSKMMDTMLDQYSMAYGDNPDVKRFGVTDTLKKQFGFSQRAASTLASSYLQGDTKQFEEMFEKEMDKKDNPNGALEDVNKQLGEQLGQMTGQLANSDKLRAGLDANLYAAADTLGRKMDNIVTKLAPILEKVQNALLKLAGNILKFVDTFLNSKLWNKLIEPAAETALDHPLAAGGSVMAGLVGIKAIKHLHNVMKDPHGLSGALKGMGKDALWKAGKLGAFGAVAYGGFKYLTKDDNKDENSAQDNSSDSPGGIFDKIYDRLEKIYEFISGDTSGSSGSSRTANGKSPLDIKHDIDGNNLGYTALAGIIGIAGIKKFHSKKGGIDRDVTDKLDKISNNANESKKASKKTESIANKKLADAKKEQARAQARYNALNKKVQKNIAEGRKNSKNTIKRLNTAKANLEKTGLKLHKEQLKRLGFLGTFIGTVGKNLSTIFGKGIGSVFTKIGSVWKAISGKFKTLGGVFKGLFDGLKSILKKVAGPLASALYLGSDAIGHLMNGDAVEGDGVNSVVNNAIPAGMTGIGAWLGGLAGGAIGSIVPGAGTAIGASLGSMAGGMFGGWVGNKLNDTDPVKQARNGILSTFGDSDKDQDKKRHEQKPWAYDDNGTYKFGDDYVAPNENGTGDSNYSPGYDENGNWKYDSHDSQDTKDSIDSFVNSQRTDTADIDANEAKTRDDLLRAAGVNQDDLSSVDSGDDSGSENKLRKADDSRMKASKDNSDKVVGQAKKEEKLSITRNKQIQMFQNLHKQLMQMFQASVKEEHGNLWKKLDIMEHILFDINKNIISCGKILNKGLVRGGGGGGLNYDFTQDHGATAEQLNKVLTGPLAGQADLIMRLCKENGIDPAALVAIARAESGGGENSKGNNFFGLMDSSHNLQSFGSIEDGIMAEIKTLKGFAAEGKTTLGAIQKEYCPDSEGGANWRKNVSAALTDMGIQVPAGGDSSNNNNYTISGGNFDGMQDATKRFFYAVANAWKQAHPELAGLEFSSGKRDGDPSASHHNDGGAFDVDNGYFEDSSLRAEYVSLINSLGGVGLDEWHGTPGAVWAHGDNIHATAPGNGGRDGSFDGTGGGDVMPDVQWSGQDSISGYDQLQQMSGAGNNDIAGLNVSQYEITTDADGVEHQTLKPGSVTANGKSIDRFTAATRQKIEENLAKGLAPNGTSYLQNDIDYLKAHGYTDMEEIKIALNQDKKYAMDADNPEFLKLTSGKAGWAKSSISMGSPFATGAYYYHHLNGMNAYWGGDNSVGADSNSIYATLLKQSGAKGNVGDHITGMKMARDQLLSSRKGFDAGIPASSYFEGADVSRGTTNIMASNVAATGMQKAVADAKRAADKARSSASTAHGIAGNIINSADNLTNSITNRQDNSTLTNAGDNTKEESVIDVNINVDNAEEAFLKKFGELLKDAIEKTGARVTSLENNTADIAKAADYLSISSAK